jgi:tetratricopeptide (TPR) repeat protein
MARLPNPAAVWTANMVVPGAGIALAGRMAAGAALAIAWGAAVAGLLLGVIWPDAVGVAATIAFAVAVVGLHVAGQILLFLTLCAAARRVADDGRNERFKAALTAYLRGEYDESASISEGLLRDDPDDVEAAYQMGAIARRRGDAATAQKWFLRAQYLDDEGKWDFQIGRELEALAARPAASSADAK